MADMQIAKGTCTLYDACFQTEILADARVIRLVQHF